MSSLHFWRDTSSDEDIGDSEVPQGILNFHVYSIIYSFSYPRPSLQFLETLNETYPLGLILECTFSSEVPLGLNKEPTPLVQARKVFSFAARRGSPGLQSFLHFLILKNNQLPTMHHASANAMPQ